MRLMQTILAIVFIMGVAPPTGAAMAPPSSGLKITGAVRNTLELNLQDLKRLSTTEVQLNEIMENSAYKGAFHFRGVPLKLLLGMAKVEKKGADFKKPVDMAVIVTDASGKSVALSWGEIFYQNGSNVVIAVSGTPIFPHKGGEAFRDKRAYRTMMRALKRKVAFPKLVVTSDFHADRCLEPIVAVEVYDLQADIPGEKSPNPYSANFRVTGNVEKELTIDKPPSHTPEKIQVHVVGEGRGYHGSHTYSGIALKELLMRAEPRMGLNTVFLVSAPDAYRALISYGELFLNPHGKRIIVADHKDGRPIDQWGEFILVLGDDLMADREVKAVCKIDVISLKR